MATVVTVTGVMVCWNRSIMSFGIFATFQTDYPLEWFRWMVPLDGSVGWFFPLDFTLRLSLCIG